MKEMRPNKTLEPFRDSIHIGTALAIWVNHCLALLPLVRELNAKAEAEGSQLCVPPRAA